MKYNVYSVSIENNHIEPSEKDPAQEINDALEIVRLLEEMRSRYALLFTNGNCDWTVLWNVFCDEEGEITTKVICVNSDLLQCLRDASAKGWKP